MGKKKNSGKSPKGRAGAKQKAQRGGNNAGWNTGFVPRAQAEWQRRLLDEADDEEQIRVFTGFAQINARRMPPRDPTVKLRHQKISFVPAGTITPVESEMEEKLKLSDAAQYVAAEDDSSEGEQSADDDIEVDFEDDTPLQTNIITDTDVDISERTAARMNIRSSADIEMEGQNGSGSGMGTNGASYEARQTSPEVLPFVIDTDGDPTLFSTSNASGKQPLRRDASPAASDSSDEVVLFHGRNKPRVINDPIQQQQPPHPSSPSQTASSAPSNAALAFNQRPIQTQQQHNNRFQLPLALSQATSRRAIGWAADTSKLDQEVNPDATWAPAPAGSWWKRPKPRPDLGPGPAEIEAHKDTPPKETRVAFVEPQAGDSASSEVIQKTQLQRRARGDRANDDSTLEDLTSIDLETLKKVERLAKISRVQAKEEAYPPASSKAREKNEVRGGNIAMLECELSSEHVQLARRMGVEEALRMEQTGAAAKLSRKLDQQPLTFADASASASSVAAASSQSQAPATQCDDSEAEETIASLQSDWKAVIREKEKAKQPDEDEIALKSPRPKRRGKRGRKKDNRQLRDVIDSGDDGSADEAAYDDYMANLAAQMDGCNSSGDGSNRFTAINAESLSGPSLVVNGKEIADDEVLDEEDEEESDSSEEVFGMVLDDDTSSEFSGPIGQDLDEMSDYNSSDHEDELEYTEKQQYEDEEDLRRRRQERMTDEQLARLLQKQQELGIDDPDLIIENGEYGYLSGDMDGVGDITAARAGLANIANISYGRSPNKHGMRRRAKRGNDNFVDASALADTVEQYGENGFDIMDFDRPSLRPIKKGRKGKLPPELDALSDEELKSTMIDAWDNDRAKKRLKKAEREQLRSEGLIGSAGKTGKADFRQKYPDGLTEGQMFAELRIFMQDDGQRSREFPPMRKGDRKDLHELASALNLNSKSVGQGKDRRPVLYKTARTLPYQPDSFDRAIKASENGWLDSNKKFGRKLAKKGAAKTPKGGFSISAADIKHGTVVGAGAAEIGKDSVGHRLMEKMGWSKGMALGREGEGRLEPVEQIMRAGRAGLG